MRSSTADLTPEKIIEYELPLGTIYPHHGAEPPEGYVFCEGQVLSHHQQDFPVEVLKVPDLRELPINIYPIDAEQGDSLPDWRIHPSAEGFRWVMRVREPKDD